MPDIQPSSWLTAIFGLLTTVGLPFFYPALRLGILPCFAPPTFSCERACHMVLWSSPMHVVAAHLATISCFTHASLVFVSSVIILFVAPSTSAHSAPPCAIQPYQAPKHPKHSQPTRMDAMSQAAAVFCISSTGSGRTWVSGAARIKRQAIRLSHRLRRPKSGMEDHKMTRS